MYFTERILLITIIFTKDMPDYIVK